EGFMSRMKTLLDGNDYRVTGEFEIYFENVTSLIFTLVGFNTQVEKATSNGRIDVVVYSKDYIYAMELNVDVSADKALEQIDSNDYTLPFAADDRKLYKIGVAFSSTTRTISEYKIISL
ncbi:MAG: PD-(D/E)XK nuclease domain-containing protein, partial [Prevotella sp.]|nr:PD-(D/E)XK nuclease domain-containing protein [Prevotella sp.]